MILDKLIEKLTNLADKGYGGDDVRLLLRGECPFDCFNPEIKDIYAITNDSKKGVSVVYIEVS